MFFVKLYFLYFLFFQINAFVRRIVNKQLKNALLISLFDQIYFRTQRYQTLIKLSIILVLQINRLSIVLSWFISFQNGYTRINNFINDNLNSQIDSSCEVKSSRLYNIPNDIFNICLLHLIYEPFNYSYSHENTKR